MRHHLARTTLLSAFAVMSAAAAAGCGKDSSEHVPPDAVARIGDTLITEKEVRTLAPASTRQGDSRRGAAQYLIVAEWLRRETRRLGVTLPADAVQTGAGERLAATTTLRLQALVQKSAGPPPSERDVARHYREHPNQYARPETRFMHAVAAGSRAQANEAKRALERGEGWKSVIGRYTTRRGSPTPPSGVVGLQPDESGRPLGAAVYAARRGTFYGPVETDQAWYVFELVGIDRHRPQSLAEAREPLRARLKADRQEAAQRALVDRLRDRYRPITLCADGVRLPVCPDGPPLEGNLVQLLEP